MQSRFERIAKQYSNGRTAVATASRWVLTELKSTKARPEWWRMLSPVLITGAATSFNDLVTRPAHANRRPPTEGFTTIPVSKRRSLEVASSPDPSAGPWREFLLPPGI
ncbi:hypothetical protein TWF106_005835 [Orbilia oligospora]|uniref:Uncharacterized protein n=1 Tax=Orbilia oligospora TaxID=2813651 RepID=A0A7C8USE8_ORBOL|nr:hypothetical protein TWF106_005835 [Orbilia oligospora]